MCCIGGFERPGDLEGGDDVRDGKEECCMGEEKEVFVVGGFGDLA